MDIKDFILIGGGLLIAAVVAHGFWIAWRARRDPLRIDLVTDIPADDDGGDLLRLRAELPNGGARVLRASEPRQESLGLEPEADAPMLLETSESEARSTERRGERRTEPRLDAPVPARADTPRVRADTTDAAPGPADQTSGVADVIMPERTVRADETRDPRRRPVRSAAQEGAPAERPDSPEPAHGRSAERPGAERTASRPARGGGQSARGVEKSARGGVERSARGGLEKTARGGLEKTARGGVEKREPRQPEPAVDELIMVNVMAPKGAPFTGGGLVETLRARGLRYGDMNIFHRVDPMTRATLYSVANVVEPGTFDVADLDNFRSPGVCFFMTLPGPEQPVEVFEDMLKVARDVAVRMGGELKDEQRSVMTGQTVEHYRQRISDFCRRRMSKRA